MANFTPERKTMKAVITLGDGTVAIQETEIPAPGPGQVLVKVAAVAQNPVDWKTVLRNKKEGTVVGCDFAGIVAGIGSQVEESTAKLGERVAGFIHGGIDKNGSFAEYLISPAHILVKIPEHWSFEEAAQLGIAPFTACQCLYQSQSLPLPSEPSPTPLDLLVWSATSSVGHFAIQFAKLGGMRVIATASPKHFEWVKSLGVEELFDYRDSKAGEKIRKLTEGNLRHAVDCIGEKTTPFQVSDALSLEGGTISIIQPYVSEKKGVETVYSSAFRILGEAFTFPIKYEPKQSDIEFGAKASKLISDALATGKIIPAPLKIFPHGLASVLDGLEFMREGKVSAEKITYRIADTPGL